MQAQKNNHHVEEAVGNCLWHHRKRQRHFIKKCLSVFQQLNKTYVLLTDVDEYITFNTIHSEYDPSPSLPLDYVTPSENIPTLINWKEKIHYFVDSKTEKEVKEVRIEGTITGLPSPPTKNDDEEGYLLLRGKKYKNGDLISTGPLIENNSNSTTSKTKQNDDDHYMGIHGVAYGNIVIDEYGQQFYLRDDFAFRDAVFMSQAPGGVPTIKDSYINGTYLHGSIYNDIIHRRWKDGTRVQIKTNWREAPINSISTSSHGHRNMKAANGGGQMIHSADRESYFVQRNDNEPLYWPPHLSSNELYSIRQRLSSVGDGTTILDVLERESNLVGEDYARETIGPCISMPRLLYGSYEDEENYNKTSIYNENMLLADIGLSIKDFVTLRYKWHAIPESRIVNKFQKTLIDVSRIPDIILQSGHEAENIHVPLKYYCRKDPPRYSTSYFRVNHYLDSFEAYSYRRNDARSSMRRCRDVSNL